MSNENNIESEVRITLHELEPIARALRERESQIDTQKRSFYTTLAALIALAGDQGRDLITAKSKLSQRGLTYSEWLEIHVASIPSQQAAKYERLATEQLSDPRQCVFAFLPPADRKPSEKAERTHPPVWERVWGLISRMNNVLKVEPLDRWDDHEIKSLRDSLYPIAVELWPQLSKEKGK